MSEPIFRRAQESDVEAIVAILADDVLGQEREDSRWPLPTSYLHAFHALDADPNHFLAVVEIDGTICGTLQISFIPGLSYQGAWRGEINSIRVARTIRGNSLLESMIKWAIAKCKARNCRFAQLTFDKKRPDSHRFYVQLGFSANYRGYMLEL
ncbi:MAG: GNAT family N-acetyltransferase [Paenalcaligenes sp.]